MSIHGKIIKGVSGGAFFALVTVLVSFLQLRLVLDFLPSHLAGIWLLFVSVGSYIAFFDLGLSPTIAREISFHLGTPNLDQCQRAQLISTLLATSSHIFRALSILVFIIAILIGGYIIHRFSAADFYSKIVYAWAIFAGGAALNLWASSPFAALYGLGYLATERIIRSLSLLLGLLLTFLFLRSGLGLIGLACAWAAQGMVSRLIARHILFHKHPELRIVRSKPDYRLAKSILAPSLKWAAMSLGAILILQTDNVVIAAIFGPAAIPNYEAVAKISITTMSVALLIVTAISPHISKAHAENNAPLVIDLLSQSVRLSTAVAVFLIAFVAVFGDLIIELWLGKGKFIGFPILWTLLLMTLLEVHHVAMANATIATGHVAFARPALIAGILNLGISIALAAQLGLLGVALGTLIAQILTNNWYAPYVTLKHFELSFKQHFLGIILPLSFLLICLLTANTILRSAYLSEVTLTHLAICLAISLALGTALGIIFALRSKERILIRSLFQKRW